MNAPAETTPPSDDWSGRTIAYLGPVGTFSEQALLGQSDLASATVRPMSTFAEVLRATEDGEVDYAFVAIENAIEGTVNATQDALVFDADLFIQREVVLPIHLDLMAQPGVTMGDITTVLSYPHALAQSRHFIARELPGAMPEAANSTAEAARLIAAATGDLARRGAAIGPRRAAEVYGLEILARAIEDHPDNATRFLLITRDVVPAPTGHDKTSIVVFQRTDEPGSLLSILHEFADRGINLTKLESRPTRRGLGDYCFLIDLEGHIADELVADALRSLRARQADVKFLGSYPIAGERAERMREQVGEAQREADAWVEQLRSHIR
ncbi:MAG: prephenate dehydratase [Acidobacteria bacterium]|nr:prephenate dehydratase [Acidobacteriota bacterium]